MADKTAEKMFNLEFIEVYHRLPALWDIISKDYSNSGKKSEQYDMLIEKYRANSTRMPTSKKLSK